MQRHEGKIESARAKERVLRCLGAAQPLVEGTVRRSVAFTTAGGEKVYPFQRSHPLVTGMADGNSTVEVIPLKVDDCLMKLGQKQYIESSDTNFPTEEGEASQLPDLDFEDGYAHKAKGHTRETVSQWFYRLKQVIDSGRNPILTVKGLEILFQKLSRTLKDIQKPNHKLLIDAINDFTIMKQLFRQLDGRLANVTTTKLKT